MDKNYFVNGHIKLIDNKTNKILVDKDNLIVNEGRHAILNALRDSLFFKIYDENSENSSFLASLGKVNSTYTFKEIMFGYGDTEVSLDNNISTIKKLMTALGEPWTIRISDTGVSSAFSDDDRSLEFTIIFTGENVFALAGQDYSTSVISELGIILREKISGEGENSSSTETDILLSRVKFDPVSIIADNTYTLKYSLYF